MLKVMTIVGTRPELIKMSRVIVKFDKNTDHVLVHTGQNYDFELNQVFFDDLGIRRPDHFLEAAGKNAAQTIANVIAKVDDILELEAPDAVMLYGDTNSCLAVIAAKRRKIPVFHMEAGNRCFDQRVPEELNRKVVDHLSDINMVLTEHARRYLLDEGIAPERVIKTGSNMAEVLNFYKDKIENSSVLESLKLDADKYFLISAHREENVDSDENLQEMVATLNAIVDEFDYPVIVSTHPRTRKRLESLGLMDGSSKILFLKPFGFFDYIKLQIEAACVISDSGTITEETSLLGLKAITIRKTHERPEGMDEGTVIMSGLGAERVIQAIKFTMDDHLSKGPDFGVVADYAVDNASSKILKIVMSYVDFVNRTVWHKNP
jgi:UDP-N-acetylglucosamine 2-epimerase